MFPKGWNETNWGTGCRGIRGTSQPELTCQLNPSANTLNITDSQASTERIPDKIEIFIQDLRNPTANVRTDPFQIHSETPDGFRIDELDVTKPLFVNFYCMFPCKTCNDTEATQCYTCYSEDTTFLYFHDYKCMDECPIGMWEAPATKKEVATCKNCEFPCVTCGNAAGDCLTCAKTYLHYDGDNTCYKEIFYYFPYLCTAAGLIVFVFLVDCCMDQTNVLPSLVPLLSIVECVVWGELISMYSSG